MDELVGFVASEKRRLLFRPGAPNQATFDAFALSKGGIVTLFQITVSEDHSIKESGLDFVWGALNDAKMAGNQCTFSQYFGPSKLYDI